LTGFIEGIHLLDPEDEPTVYIYEGAFPVQQRNCLLSEKRSADRTRYRVTSRNIRIGSSVLDVTDEICITSKVIRQFLLRKICGFHGGDQ
jgi:hypothetical protein